ncbi:STAS domain-containing protein, partial [Actinoplanes sp. NPDC051859]|uniref:STAS domain-containing protein n=1 Tax=Actinoplanes sp. NPDC051859 TaxID=3363909 RepID=UPI0037AB1BCC
TASSTLRHVLINLVDAREATRILIDLDKVDFIDATAITAIIDGCKAAHQAGTTLRLTNAHGLVHDTFAALGMLTLFAADPRSPAN